MNDNGPSIRAMCHGCIHVQSERYQVQGDVGRDVSCTHPSIGVRTVGDTRWETPDWCPLIIERAEQYLVELRLRLRAPKESAP